MKTETVYLNLYKYGVSPYWTMHTSREIAVSQAQVNCFNDNHALHVAMPVELEINCKAMTKCNCICDDVVIVLSVKSQ